MKPLLIAPAFMLFVGFMWWLGFAIDPEERERRRRMKQLL